jgi:hypothetical protein
MFFDNSTYTLVTKVWVHASSIGKDNSNAFKITDAGNRISFRRRMAPARGIVRPHRARSTRRPTGEFPVTIGIAAGR